MHYFFFFLYFVVSSILEHIKNKKYTPIKDMHTPTSKAPKKYDKPLKIEAMPKMNCKLSLLKLSSIGLASSLLSVQSSWNTTPSNTSLSRERSAFPNLPTSPNDTNPSVGPTPLPIFENILGIFSEEEQRLAWTYTKPFACYRVILFFMECACCFVHWNISPL